MKENIQKWVDALRSGKYKQTQNQLKTTDGYCCLGVYCEINHRVINADDTQNDKLYKWMRREIETNLVSIVINMNDQGVSFDDIANYVVAKFGMDSQQSQKVDSVL